MEVDLLEVPGVPVGVIEEAPAASALYGPQVVAPQSLTYSLWQALSQPEPSQQ